MSVIHNNITDPDIHEPKDISTASAGSVYVADGAGSGAWLNIRRNVIHQLRYDDLSQNVFVSLPVMTNGVMDRVSISVQQATTPFSMNIILNGSVVSVINFPFSTGYFHVSNTLALNVVEGDTLSVSGNGMGSAVEADVFFRCAESIT